MRLLQRSKQLQHFIVCELAKVLILIVIEAFYILIHKVSLSLKTLQAFYIIIRKVSLSLKTLQLISISATATKKQTTVKFHCV